MQSSYVRFAAMIATSMAAMYLMTYLNSWALDHVFFSESRLYMIFYMGSVMAVIMLAFMLGMYRNKAANASIVLGAAVVFAGSLWLMRSQTLVGEVSYMKAMIPHHSIAILTSRRANISDSRVRKLADQIIEAQVREIEEMKRYIADLEAK